MADNYSMFLMLFSLYCFGIYDRLVLQKIGAV